LPVVLALLATACVNLPAAPAAPDGEIITYETVPGPLCGRCDSIKIVALSDGYVWIEAGHWAATYRDWVVQRRRVRVSAERYARFRAQLAPYRPAGELLLDEHSRCEDFWTDMREVTIAWRGGGADARLRYNFGCDQATKAAMANALSGAPGLLGIRHLPNPLTDWTATTRM
jgi:hypothetical protein